MFIYFENYAGRVVRLEAGQNRNKGYEDGENYDKYKKTKTS